MKAKFITVKGSERLGREPFYVGVLQHERTMSRREAYEYIAGKTGYTPTAVRAVFMAVAEYIRENQARGNITYFDGVASIRNYVRGAETRATMTFSDLHARLRGVRLLRKCPFEGG